MPKALALYSGGLDSILAILLVKKQAIDVVALKFITGFTGTLKQQDIALSQKFHFEIKLIDIREKFLEIIKSPKYGYGKNLNPCIDCKILMLKEAKALMYEFGASFVVTGEVLGQRPMTQRKEVFKLMEKESSLEGLIVRPLSAKLLPPTKPQIEGLINIELFGDIYGRTRKPQLKLAEEFGIKQIPQPAGGCLLTDPSFCNRLSDLIKHDELTVEDIELLKLGRHFRVSEKCKVVVGRDRQENEKLINNFEGIFIYPADLKGPVVLVRGICSEKEIDLAASITVYYCKKRRTELIIDKSGFKESRVYDTITEEEFMKYRI